MKGLNPTWSPTKCEKRLKMTGKKVWMCCSPGLGGKLWKGTTRRSGKTKKCLIVNAVLYLARQEMAYRLHNESSTSLRCNYRELLKSFGKLDYGFDRHLHDRLQGAERCKSGGVFTGVSSDVQNDAIECTGSAIKDQSIKK